MAADYKLILETLLSFYDFRGKTMTSVGAGGGQIIGYARHAGHVIAVDQDRAALDAMKSRAESLGIDRPIELICTDFMMVDQKSDVLLFEFSLHEMPSAEEALRHALSLAPDVVVFDHGPGSRWAYYVVEEDKVAEAWKAVDRIGAKKTSFLDTFQFFENHDELVAKVSVQGEEALRRAGEFKGARDFRIPMRVGLGLLQRP